MSYLGAFVSTPKPEALEATIREIGRKAKELYEVAMKLHAPYRTAFLIGVGSASSDGMGSNTQVDQADPTFATIDAGYREHARAVCTEVARRARAGAAVLEDEIRTLDSAYAMLQGKKGVVREAGPWDYAEALQREKQIRVGAFVTDKQLAESTAKQKRDRG